ncbi:MAG: PEP-utilizing enzyme [Candidatus Woesearchaeota archaeon]
MKRLSLTRIEELVKSLMEKEDRKDVEFRHIIAVSEVGDVGKYITHDPVLNPNARPHGTKEDEVLAYGQAFVQLAALAYLRKIPIKEAFEKGLQNWIDADWRKKKTQKNLGTVLKGIPASPGLVTGEAEVVKGRSTKNISENRILVVEYATPEFSDLVNKSIACISDHGGATCHLANIAREYGIPCVVGTGDATKRIKPGDLITVDGTKGEVYLKR